MASSEGSKTQSQMPSVSQTPTLRIVSAPQGKIVTGTSKTITFAQAKQMGIINFNQIIQPATKVNTMTLPFVFIYRIWSLFTNADDAFNIHNT